MTLRPCLTCGEPCEGSHCGQHRPERSKPAAERGYDRAWHKLSARARRLQPFCEHCGTTDDLQCDHLPEAWRRKARGLPVRLADVRVLCGPCNRAAGPARPGIGEHYDDPGGDPPGAGEHTPPARRNNDHIPPGGIR